MDKRQIGVTDRANDSRYRRGAGARPCQATGQHSGPEPMWARLPRETLGGQSRCAASTPREA